MTSSIQVSEEMIAVGLKAYHRSPGISCKQWNSLGPVLERVYLAMKAAEPLAQGDEAWMLAIAREAAIPAHENHADHIRDGKADDWITVRSAMRALRAALVRSPIGDDVQGRRKWAELIADQYSVDDPASIDAIEEGLQRGLTLRPSRTLIDRLEGVYSNLTPGAIDTADLDGMAFTIRDTIAAITAIGSQSIEPHGPQCSDYQRACRQCLDAFAAWKTSQSIEGERFEPMLYEQPVGQNMGEWCENVHKTELYRRGDTVLIWVNEGDLWPDGPFVKRYGPLAKDEERHASHD